MKVGIFSVFLFLFLVCRALESLYEPLRYLKYVLPLLAFSLYFFIDKAKLNYNYFSYLNSFLIFYLFVILFLFFKMLFFDTFQVRFIPNAGLMLMPLLFIFFLSPFFREKNIKEYIKLAFFFNVFLFLYLVSANIFLIFSDLKLLEEAAISSNISTENALAYTFGLFLFYFITEKYPKGYIITCAIIFVLSFKRIAIAAFIISYIYYFLSTNVFKLNIKKYRHVFILLGVTANLLFIKLVFLIVNGDLEKMIIEYTHLSTNNFVKGRQNFYKIVVEKVGSISWSGIGLGKVDEILTDYFGKKWNLHSDILNNYFQFGAILFCIWLLLLFYKTSFSHKSLAILIYFNIQMFTDNVFIYFDFMFYFYFFVLIYISQTFYQKDEPSLVYNTPKISTGE